MGVLTNWIDLNELISQYPNHIICNIDTSQLFCKSFNLLPPNEEEKIRRKIQFVKNPQIYFIEEINEICYDKTRPKDTSSLRSLAKNVQYIFFRVLRGPLENYKNKYIINNNVFDPEKFLYEFDCEDYRYFWNKIIQTLAFEYFIFSDQYIDDSNNIIFENICNLTDEESYINQNELYKFSLNVQNYVGKIFKDLEKDKKLKMPFGQNMKVLIDDHKKVINLQNLTNNIGTNNSNINSNYKTPLKIRNVFYENIALKESKENIFYENKKVNEQENQFSEELNFLK